jgi:hypothetical protein
MQENKEIGSGLAQVKEPEDRNSLEEMTLAELEELLIKTDADLKEVRTFSWKMNSMRDRLKGYIKRRRRSGK